MKKVNLILKKILILILFLSSLLVKAQLGGGGFTNDTPYDLTDFKPLTAEAFISDNFSLLKQEYDIDPSTLIKGYRIEVIPAKQGFRPSVSNHQIYSTLVNSAVLEWAIENNYTVYLDNGYRIVQKSENGTEISIHISPSFSSPKFNKTIAQEFTENHNNNWNNQTSGWSVFNTNLSTFHGLKAFEKENLAINDTKLIDDCQKEMNVLIQSGETDNEKSASLIKSFANHYEGSVELIRSKYGEVSGSIEINQPDKGIKGNLIPVKEMMESMLSFCDHKINMVRSLFMEKNKTN